MKLSESIAYRIIGDNCIVILADKGEMIFLNETAGFILQLVDEYLDKYNIINRITERYGIKRNEAEQDYEQIMAQFLALNILKNQQTLYVSPEEESNMIIPQNDEMRGQLKAYCQENFIPLQCFIELTSLCDHACKHCYVAPVAKPKNASTKILSIEEYKNILSKLSTMGCLEIIFTGGEASLNKDWLDLCTYARSLRFSVIIKTHAARLSHEIICKLRELHITEVQVSLYSMNPEIHDEFVGRKGSHAKTVSALRYMHSVGQRCRISCVVTMSNYQHLYGLKEFAESIDAQIGFDLIVTRRLDHGDDPLSERLTSQALVWLDHNGVMSNIIFEGSRQIKAPQELERLINYPSEDDNSPICGAANTMMAIGCTGDVRPCITFPVSLGNIREKLLQDIWWGNNKTAINIRKLRNRDFSECASCGLSKACPRCIATIYQETGNPVGKAGVICQTSVYHNKYSG
jgi:radical SAM protein with 4Fe4S-binding SPASM domain